MFEGQQYRGAALPPLGTHAKRETAGAPSDPQTILSTAPMGTNDWLRVLGAILKLHNHEHSAKHKGVSFKTMLNRQRFLAKFFRDVRKSTIYHECDPRTLGNRHIQAAVDLWLSRKLSTGTIHAYLSILRTYGEWIGKPDLVRKVEYYVGTDSVHAKRHQVATVDHSWTAKAVQFEAKLPEIRAFDFWVGLQIELCYRFGMRPKESRHFRPHGALRTRAEAFERDAAAFPEHDTFLRICEGTKGGRPRDVPVSNAAQRELLQRVEAAVAPGMFVGKPGQTAQQSQRRFYYVLERFGITRAELGVVAHGLRHQFVNDTFEAETGAPSPVRGGTTAPAGDKRARQRAARLLGHGRTRVTSCYLGSPSHRPVAAAPAEEVLA
ncbi:phage integrase N-terminal domain-containing protein [Piscinibacter gummiphilus]|uniref:Integrase domain-containing protein n=1 Tax=Piscinibacter gummiphilus TaxID=946333 RepID=A0ABZ0D1N9_9BURK|nr:phage integrase N-terminal domain-containing protein [Piscinibacter gummiphilus]WOB11116.1 integrase domain-containing protein [Piscinibacter gummiphilus]